LSGIFVIICFVETNEVDQMNQWTDILTAEQIEASHAETAKLDPRFAARDRAFWRSQAANQLRVHAARAWESNSPTQYQMARSYLETYRPA
jgi:hypothetical protein